MDKMDNGHYGHFKNAFLVQLTSAKKESRVLLVRPLCPPYFCFGILQ